MSETSANTLALLVIFLRGGCGPKAVAAAAHEEALKPDSEFRVTKAFMSLSLRLGTNNCADIFFRKILVQEMARAEKSGKQIPFLRTNLKKAFFKFEPF
jgi:hypothetical protein